MAIGQKMTIKIHEDDAGVVVFDSVQIVPFTYAPSYYTDDQLTTFVGATTVKKEDFVGSTNDAFVVQVTTDSGNPFSTSQTIAQLTTLAQNAVNAVYGNGEAGDPS
jgi:hypothetical protein